MAKEICANNAAKASRVKLTTFDEVKAAPVSWLWEGYIARGKITVVQGDPGNGKTALAIKLAALFSMKQPMPTGNAPPFIGNVLYQSGEDDPNDTIKPRLMACGADCGKVAFADASGDDGGLDLSLFEEAITLSNAAVAVVDPFQHFLSPGQDITRVKTVRPIMKELGEIAARTNVALIIIGHMNKTESKKGLYRGLGTIDIAAAARSVLLVAKKPGDPETRIVSQIKNNLSALSPPVAFHIGMGGAVEFLGECDISPEELLGNAVKKSRLGICMELVKNELEKGDVPANYLYEMCLDQGAIPSAISEVKKRLMVHTVQKSDGCWYWTLGAAGAADTPKTRYSEKYGELEVIDWRGNA